MTRMDCGEVRELLHVFEDDELPASERAAIALHFQECAECTAALNSLRTLRSRIHASGTFAGPAGLEARVHAAIGSADTRKGAPIRRRFGTMAASYVLVAILSAIAAYTFATRELAQTAAVRDVVTAHVRSLLSDQIVQVASADTHTVKPWFMGKVPFAPDVADLSTLDFPLVGGRVDHVLDRPVAALVYGRRKHRISVFILPQAQGAVGAFQDRRDGYNVVAWRRDGFAYFAASDLNASELREFAQLLERRVSN